MDGIHKYYWKINIQADAAHIALEHLPARSFELETLDPPPDVGETFTFYLDTYGRESADERSVEVTVLRKTRVLEHRQGRPMECHWYTVLNGKITGSAAIP